MSQDPQSPDAPTKDGAPLRNPDAEVSANTPAEPAASTAPTTATADAASEGAELDADDGDESEGAAAAAGDGSSGEDGEKKKKKRRRKKKAQKSDAAPHHAPMPFHVGEDVFGKVTAVLDTAIMVDLAGKALAIFDRGEMEADDLLPAIDDKFVGKVLFDGGRGGLVVLTRKPLRDEEAKPRVEQAAKDGTLITGLVTGVIKGGLEILIDGLRAFAPASGMDLHPRSANFTNLLGQRLDFKVTSYEGQGKDIVVTRRPMLEREAHERRKKAREMLTEGAEMDGVVRTAVEWGAFVALPEAENIEGLIHVSELSHNPRDRVTDVLSPGQKLRVKIQKIDEKGKIWLSRKALIEDPFDALTRDLSEGSIVSGTVTKVEEFGAFIKVADGIEGLCHVSDMGAVRVEDARTVMKPGDVVEVVVHRIDKKERRVALHPAPPAERRDEPKQKVQKGSTVEAEIVKVDQKGINLRVLGLTGRQARAYMPPGQTGTQRGAELRKHFNVGDRLQAMVIDQDPKTREAKLSISRKDQEEERRAHKDYQTKVKQEAKFGTLGDLLKQKLGG